MYCIKAKGSCVVQVATMCSLCIIVVCRYCRPESISTALYYSCTVISNHQPAIPGTQGLLEYVVMTKYKTFSEVLIMTMVI